jgi:DNA polymerase III subunit epsilon
MNDFVAIDVETANPDLESICQIGVATFRNGALVDLWSQLIDPDGHYFDEMNMSIHGIHESHIEGAPTFLEVYSTLTQKLEGQTVVSHTGFDRRAISKAQTRYSLEPYKCMWLDSARIARRAWEQFSHKDYGLANVSKHFGIKFTHHDAAEDARACGEIVLQAILDTGIELEDWFDRVSQPIDPNNPSQSFATQPHLGNPEGHMYGECACFTGALSVPRAEAITRALACGISTKGGVTKKTTMLIVGDQDISKLAGYAKSSKHRKADKVNQECIKRGLPPQIRILTETDFFSVIADD